MTAAAQWDDFEQEWRTTAPGLVHVAYDPADPARTVACSHDRDMVHAAWEWVRKQREAGR